MAGIISMTKGVNLIKMARTIKMARKARNNEKFKMASMTKVAKGPERLETPN